MRRVMRRSPVVRAHRRRVGDRAHRCVPGGGLWLRGRRHDAEVVRTCRCRVHWQAGRPDLRRTIGARPTPRSSCSRSATSTRARSRRPRGSSPGPTRPAAATSSSRARSTSCSPTRARCSTSIRGSTRRRSATGPAPRRSGARARGHAGVAGGGRTDGRPDPGSIGRHPHVTAVPEMLILAVRPRVRARPGRLGFRARTARRSSVGLRSGGTHAGSRRPRRSSPEPPGASARALTERSITSGVCRSSWPMWGRESALAREATRLEPTAPACSASSPTSATAMPSKRYTTRRSPSTALFHLVCNDAGRPAAPWPPRLRPTGAGQSTSTSSVWRTA